MTALIQRFTPYSHHAMKLDFDDLTNTQGTAPTELLSEERIGQLKIAFFGVVTLACFGAGLSQAFSPAARQIRSEIQQQEQQQTRDLTLQQQQQRHGQQARQIAEERYREGCLLVYTLDADGNVIALYEGMTVVDSTTNQPLPDGTTVCDPNGATAVLEDGGQVGGIAVTPDNTMVQQLVAEGKLR